MLQLYNILLQFPLFQGMGYFDLEKMVAHTRIDFRKHAAGERVAEAGAKCNEMLFLTNGTLRASRTAADGSYTIEEDIDAPFTAGSETMFGLTREYAHTLTTVTAANLFSLDKQELTRLLDSHDIIRINLLNAVSAAAQKRRAMLWTPAPGDLQQRIAVFLRDRCIKPQGRKVVIIKMTRLAEELNDNRLNVSRALNDWQDRGLVTLGRQRIVIPCFELLLRQTLDGMPDGPAGQRP